MRAHHLFHIPPQANACDLLARIGLRAFGGNQALARNVILSTEPKPRGANKNGCQWMLPVTWPDRVPALKTWSGQQTLLKLIKSRQALLASSNEADLMAVRVVAQGVTGLDLLSAPRAIDIGFSLDQLDIPIEQRVGMELLAIHALCTVPLVSLPSRRRECGVIYDGRLWTWPVEERDTHYYSRWGVVTEREIDDPMPEPDVIFEDDE